MRPRLRRTGLVLAVTLPVLSLLDPLGPAALAASAAPGTVTVTVTAPDGVPASVALVNQGTTATGVAAKATAGTSTTAVLPLAAGAYKVVAEPITVSGRFYTVATSRPEVPVKSGQNAVLTATYTLDDSARDFHASSVEPTRVTLTWTADAKYKIVVRRTSTTTPAKAPDQGVEVPVSAGSAVDSGLTPGSRYTYALFTQYKGKWVGPMVVRLATVSPDPHAATYVASPQTQLLTSADVVSAVPTGAGVHAVLATGLPVPVIGSAIVLPISASLQGGFLGVVTAVGADGRTVELVAGGISDAFDYYKLDVGDFTTGDVEPAVSAKVASAAKQAAASDKAARVKAAKVTNARKAELRRLHRNAAAVPAQPSVASGLQASSVGKVAPAAAPVPPVTPLPCLGGSASAEVSFSPKLSLAGHFNATVSKYSILGVDVPTGASFDMAMAATLSATASVTAQAAFTCNAPVVPILYPLATTPVPISFYFSPTAQVYVGGQVQVSNIGLAVTAGFESQAHFGLTDGVSLSANPIFSAVPTTPKVVASGQIGVKVGGQVIVGPGAGTAEAGVIAGVGGELNPLDASFGPVFPVGDPRYNVCLQAQAAFTRSLYLVAKAWLGNWDVTKTFTVDALKGSTPYGGSPWFFPSGCKDAVDPGDTVIGDGVTKIDDQVTGGDNQWGYVPGLVPDKKTWVLSTGRIDEVVGAPSADASTDLGGDGDADLTALAGRQTYDAVSYTATVVPTGSTLHVKYAFASEEYPEYVGSRYNDVMAVYVNGVNCATVPGTDLPVAINTVNMNLNSQYYVDNSSGAAGYSTTMDGLTVPLECKVHVEIGKPVTVKIAVADASDGVLDSAVALLDKGIWSD